MPGTGHSFFSRCQSHVALGGAHSMPTAVSGQQVAFPISVDAYSYFFGHSAWLTPWRSQLKTLSAAHEWNEQELLSTSLKTEPTHHIYETDAVLASG
jgi:hypothetical protein